MIRAQRQLGLTTVAITALLFVAVTGCFSRKKVKTDPASAVRPSATQPVSTTTAQPATGRISSVNQPGKFAVVNFPVGQVPANNTRLSIFRAGTKVGEMKISGPAADSFTVGDIISGSANDGDEVRPE